MSETTLLRNSAIVRNASVGTTPPHGPVKTGELPLVQVRMAPGGPQVHGPQHKPVEILPPRDANSAIHTGGLPMVNVKMTSQGPQLDDGQDKPVVILPSKNGKNVAAGGLPMLQVKMENGRPQVQTVPNVQSAPPQIQSAAPTLSQPRVARVAAPPASQPRIARVVAAPTGQARVARVAAPQVPLPPITELTTDQLMLCRHLVDKYLIDLVAADAPSRAEAAAKAIADPSAGLPPESDAVQLAKATISTIDDVLVAKAVHAEAAALAAATPDPVISAVPAAPAAPATAYATPRFVARSPAGVGMRSSRNSAMAPRRVARSASSGLPPVIVKMENGRPAVQNQEAVAQTARSASSGLPPVIVKMENGRPAVQNQAAVAQARAAAMAETAETPASEPAMGDAQG